MEPNYVHKLTVFFSNVRIYMQSRQLLHQTSPEKDIAGHIGPYVTRMNRGSSDLPSPPADTLRLIVPESGIQDKELPFQITWL